MGSQTAMVRSSLLDRVENARALDGVVGAVQRAVRWTIRPGPVRDALHGVPLGHSLHPLLVQVPIGTFLSAAVLDAAGADRQARTLIGVGLVAATPATVAGVTDWSELHEQQMRTGLLHWAGNLAGLGLYAASWVMRRRGERGAGLALSIAGLSVIGTSGAVGGRLAYRQAAGANHAEDVPHLVGSGWHDVGTAGDFPENELVRRSVNGVPVVIMRRGEVIHALADSCSHLSGPLSQGQLSEEQHHGDGPCLVCPWHHSTFRLRDGAVVHGPATVPQPSFEIDRKNGRVMIRLPNAG